MPTERFFNLPDEKKQRITVAAAAEFSRVPFDQVSINQIIQAADIPRGSFYQYFGDKLDLLEFILRDCRTKVEQAALTALTETGGDLFSIFPAMLDAILDQGAETQNARIFLNVFPNLKLEDGGRIFPYFRLHALTESRGCGAEIFQTYLSYLDGYLRQGIPLEDITDTLEILVAMLHYTVAQLYFYPKDQQRIRTHFDNKLAILKRGLLREETDHVKI